MNMGLRTSLFMTIPFLLLFGSERVVITTTMYGDVSGTRQVRVMADPSLQNEVTKWMREMTPGFHRDGIATTAHRVVVSRSTQVNDLSSCEDVEAVAYDIVRRPFSFVTEYRWEERVAIEFLSNEKEEAAAPFTVFEYRLMMPGEVQSATPAAQVDGRRAIWELTAEEEEYTLSATATSLRWDLIILLIYVFGYVGYRLTAFLVRRAKLRPRKI